MEVATENRIGYKKTKLGWIPEDWDLDLLSNHAQIKGRVGWKGYTVDDLRDFGPLVIGASQIDKENKLDLSEPKYLSQEKYNESPEIKIEPGDVLIVQRGSLGKVAIVNRAIGDATINPSMAILKTFGHLTPEFLYLQLCSFHVQKIILTEASSTGVPMISQKQIGTFYLLIPPLPEQKKIAAILSTWDKAIDTLSKLISEKEQLKNGLMQQLLTGKKRFAGFTGKWKEVKISEIGEVQTGNTPSKKDDSLWGGDQPWATADDMGKKYIIDTEQKLSNKGFKKARIAKAGSILVTCIASIGKNAITKIDCGFNQQINAISPNSNFDSDFIFYLIEFNTNLLLTFAGAGAMPMLNKGTFVKIKLTIPTLREQQKIASVLSTADRELELLKQELTNLTDQKKGLMQKLLTGEVRVKN